MCDDLPGDNKDEPDKCSCWGLTMVGYTLDQYWSTDKDGELAGHHPDCQYYEPPPRFLWAKNVAKRVRREAGPVSPLRALATAVYDLATFLEKTFPDAKADGKT